MDKNVLGYFPDEIKDLLLKLSFNELSLINEINITAGQPILLKIGGKNYFLGCNGNFQSETTYYIVKNEDINAVFNNITKSSVYAYKRYINDGFLTLENGHRVGVIGDCITEHDKVISVNNINSLCFRITHDVNTVTNLIYDDIYCKGKVKNTIIISPPGCGKTTLLRSIAKVLSKPQYDKNIIKCSIVDERFEIASCVNGVSSLDIGLSSSVISGCKKNIAIPMIVRSMSPDVIITDELATADDVDAIKYAYSSGCSIIATVHGSDEFNNELRHYNLQKLFDVVILLSTRNGPGTIEKIIKD